MDVLQWFHQLREVNMKTLLAALLMIVATNVMADYDCGTFQVGTGQLDSSRHIYGTLTIGGFERITQYQLAGLNQYWVWIDQFGTHSISIYPDGSSGYSDVRDVYTELTCK